MSAGNLKTQGQKGSNMPFQLAVLQLLNEIWIASGGAGPTGGATEATQLLVKNAVETLVTDFSTTVRVPSMIRANAPGVVAAGARSVSVYNAGLSNGTWLGQIIKPGEQLNFEAGGQQDTLDEFAYDGSSTDLVIIKVV